MRGYFKARYKGDGKISRSMHNVLIRRRLFGGLKLTVCHGYHMKETDEHFHYKNEDELRKDWKIEGVAAQEVY